MENNQEISVRKESTHLKSGEAIKYEIKNGLTIRELSNPEPLKQALRKIFVLIGIRSEQMPNEEEKTILITFIRERFQNFTAIELVLAFENALIGTFKVDTEHFGQFTIKYIAKILNAYTEHRNKLYIEVEQEKQKERLTETEEERRIKVDKFKQVSIELYKKSLVCGEWQGDMFHSNAIARDIAPNIHQHIKNTLWNDAKKKKYLQDKAINEDSKEAIFENIGLTAERYFSELIVIEGIKQKIRL